MRVLDPHEIDSVIMLVTAGCGLLINLAMAKVLHSGKGHGHGHGHGHCNSHIHSEVE